jgi:pyroglutamyl-peptidase
MEPMKTILITGFTPFPGAPENPTAILVEAIMDGRIKAPDGVDLEARLLPAEFGASWEIFQKALVEVKPNAIVEFGLSARAIGFTLECIARNDMGPNPDNSGYQPQDSVIEPATPLVLPTGLPVEDIFVALKEKDLPLEYSQSAGAYICNHLFYRTMSLAHSERPRIAGFIHIPYLEEQRDRLEAEGRIDQGLAAMSEAQLFEGVEILLGQINR